MTINTVLDQVAENKITAEDALKIIITENMGYALEYGQFGTLAHAEAQRAIWKVQASQPAITATATAATPMTRCSCGHTVPTVQVMNASNGTSCPDCYDRMSE